MKIRIAAALLVLAGCKTPPKAAPAKPLHDQTATATRAEAPSKPMLEVLVPSPIEDWRKQQPPHGTPKAIQLPTFQKDRLKNGLTLLTSQVGALPVASFLLVVRGGSSLDPPEKAGVHAFAFSLLDEGAGKRDALAFSDAVADLGASFGAGASQDGGTLAIGGLARNADAMMALLADAALRPRLDPKDFARVKSQLIASLTKARGSPQGLAAEYLPSMVYGPTHPYGHPPNGTLGTIPKIELADLKSALVKSLVPGQTALIAVGAPSAAEVKALAEKHFGKWHAGGPTPAPPEAVAAKPRQEIVLVDKSGSPQTMVMFGRPIFGKGHPDELPLIVANEIFGGAFSSRLNMNLREEKGFAYGAQSTASLRRNVGAMLAYAMVRADATGASLKEFLNELNGMAERPPTTDEIQRAKDGLVRSLQGEFERTAQIATAASALYVYDLPLDYFAGYPGRILAVSGPQVTDAAKQYLDPKLMQLLLVGDAAQVKSQVEPLAIGPLELRSP